MDETLPIDESQSRQDTMGPGPEDNPLCLLYDDVINPIEVIEDLFQCDDLIMHCP